MLVQSLLVSSFLLASVQAGPTTPAQGLAKRQSSLPVCDDTSRTYEGPYTDGEGTYVTSDRTTHPYKFPKVRKCWYDYYVLETSVEHTPWQKASGDIYCTGTQTCTATKLVGKEVCQERSESVSVNVGAELEGISLGLSFEVTDSESKCVQGQDLTACAWDDGACHTVWTQQQVLKQKGYRRQRCNWGNGDETQCMDNWEQTTPSDFVDYGCGSKCTDTNTCGNTDGTPCSK
ncbi:hypothetical protein FVEN_g8848 [Fusarium venenatum]|uniref:Uncharacterized protein n=1 Tax=Fusarium venenatum TaxID=56646 RepID=A0A2L2TVJ1_9HYPO|nr:uncharacterized protein FVRRES_02102 [Fusarium venenatum]KAG8353156.1 hypothetical protein FVEN_g8848 [Fusarium venenatum]KAH7004773.1 hypothetical protein EDB82DRAFT_487829 [Fusarium venenatum]CEI65590.1 unnamed protein product [Fusarium venenatum]